MGKMGIKSQKQLIVVKWEKGRIGEKSRLEEDETQ